MSELLLKRVDELRAEKQKLLIQQEQELTDAKLTWEAEMILQTEELGEHIIIRGMMITEDPESYTQRIIAKYCGNYMAKYNNPNHLDNHRRRMMVEEAAFKQNYMYDYIFNIVQPIYRLRREKIKREAEEKQLQLKREAEEKQLQLKREAEEKEQLRRQTLLDTLNERIKTTILSKATRHTFTDLTMSDYDTKYGITLENYSRLLKKEYLVQSTDNSWRHLNCDRFPQNRDIYPYDGQHKCGKTYDMPSSWHTYYEEGKVPFCTKCPVCNNPTKLNYVLNCWGGITNLDGTFTEVFCDKHYKYDCHTEKHYKMDRRGISYQCRIRSKHLPFGSPHYVSTVKTTLWDPTGQWLEWDPTDPDALERKQKEIEDITKQIAELQTKLAFLKSC